MKYFIVPIILLFMGSSACAQQKLVSITIDDVPNVHLVRQEGFSSRLLNKIDSMRLPVAIFINEGNLAQTTDKEKNTELLKKWVLDDLVTVGNHGYAHLNCGEIGFDAFRNEVLNGEKSTRNLLKGSGKSEAYFRFPFNATGKDSLSQAKMRDFLSEHGYLSTPFTVESEDWLYAQLYEKAFSDKDFAKAASIGKRYVERTLQVFAYFDGLTVTKYGRPISQIYLCHDSRLNADYLPQIIGRLAAQGYQFISLPEALKDKVYASTDYYHGDAGFSWIYRWIPDVTERKTLMRAEPADPKAEKELEELTKKQ